MSHAMGLVGLATLLSQLTLRIGQQADKPESIPWNQTGRVMSLLVTVTEENGAGRRAGTGLGGTPWLSHLLCDFEIRSFTSMSLHFPSVICGD